MAADSLPSRLLAISLRKFFNFLGYSGVLFILYGVISAGTGSVWEPLERWVTPASALLTLLGVVLTAASAYFYAKDVHEPELFSRFVSAPVTIGAGIAAIIYLLSRGSIPAVIVNGFALLGIAGGLFRIQRNPGES